MGLYNLIQLSLLDVDVPVELLTALLSFWASGYNAFIFELSPMSLMLWDIFMFLELPITGEENFCASLDKHDSYITLLADLESKIRNVGSYTKIMELFFEKSVTKLIIATEHLIFI